MDNYFVRRAHDGGRSMNRMDRVDKRADLMVKLQQELERRTRVEEEAIRLIGECEFEKANELLKSLNDETIKQIQAELDALRTEAAEEEEDQGKQKEAKEEDLLLGDMLVEKRQRSGSDSQDRVQKYADLISKKGEYIDG